jgi:hypothetical protein
MTQETYRKMHGLESPSGKHCKQEYRVLIMPTPASAWYQFTIQGLDEARQSILGAWNAEITRVSDGKVIQ